MEVERLSKMLFARLEDRRGRLTSEKVRQIKQLIREMMADVESGRRKRERLGDEVAHIEKLIELKEIDRSDKVLRLDEYRPQRFPLSWNERQAPEPSERLAFISGDTEANWRRAVDLHHASGRYALVNYHDISREVWADSEAMKKLGAVTVFIPEISKLTTDEQDRLSRFAQELAEDVPDDGVHFVVATTSKLRFTN